MHRLPLLASLIAVLVLATANPGAAQLFCDSGLFEDQSCSIDANCWSCAGGQNDTQPCGADFDCQGSCGFSFEPCLDTNDCSANSCVGFAFCDSGDTNVCQGGPNNGLSCESSADCPNECGWNGQPCFNDGDCAVNACENAGICDNSAICLDSNLPVELSSFDATVDGAAVLLQWRTESELNNAGFHIERQLAGDDARDWLDVGFVEGRGSTILPQSYSFRVDDLPIGRQRFRLKQVDLDGAFEYSPEVEAIIEVPGQFVLEPAYPNPFNPTTTVRFAVSTEQVVVASLHDASGKVVRELFRGSAPANEAQTISIDGDGLASGTYHVRLTGQHFATSEQITLVK